MAWEFGSALAPLAKDATLGNREVGPGVNAIKSLAPFVLKVETKRIKCSAIVDEFDPVATFEFLPEARSAIVRFTDCQEDPNVGVPYYGQLGLTVKRFARLDVNDDPVWEQVVEPRLPTFYTLYSMYGVHNSLGSGEVGASTGGTELLNYYRSVYGLFVIPPFQAQLYIDDWYNGTEDASGEVEISVIQLSEIPDPGVTRLETSSPIAVDLSQSPGWPNGASVVPVVQTSASPVYVSPWPNGSNLKVDLQAKLSTLKFDSTQATRQGESPKPARANYYNTTNMAANAIVNGSSRDVHNTTMSSGSDFQTGVAGYVDRIKTSVVCDQPGLRLLMEVSHNGSTWQPIADATVAAVANSAGVNKYAAEIDLPVTGRYYRFVLINGGTIQADVKVFQVYTA